MRNFEPHLEVIVEDFRMDDILVSAGGELEVTPTDMRFGGQVRVR